MQNIASSLGSLLAKLKNRGEPGKFFDMNDV